MTTHHRFRFPPGLRAALLQGVALSTLSACGGSTVTPQPDGDGSGGAGESTTSVQESGGSHHTADGGTSTGGTHSTYPLLPGEDDRACVGENYGGGFGYHGRCCPEFSCMKAAADGTCPATHDNAILKLPGYPPGSGTCSCEPAEGPFAYNPDNTAVIAEGACCYVIHSIGCDGRPLRQEDSLIVAAVVVRRDWMAA